MQLFKKHKLRSDLFLGIVSSPEHNRTIFYLETPYYVKIPELLFYVFIIKRTFIDEFSSNNLHISSPKLYLPILPNLSRTGRICLRDSHSFLVNDKSPEKVCKIIVDKFWTSSFSSHFNEGYNTCQQFEECLMSKEIKFNKYKLDQFSLLDSWEPCETPK